MTVACAVLLSLGVALPPLTHSALALGAVLLVFGAAFGGINVAFNSAAVDLVAALGRPVMPSFHAAFSLGGMLGAGLGSLVAGSLSPTRHLLGITAIGLLVTAVAAPALLRHGPPEPPEPPDRTSEQDARETGPRRLDGRTRGLVVVLGLIAGCTAYGEGALADWGALHLEADLDTSPGVAAIGYSCFALAMTIGSTDRDDPPRTPGQDHGARGRWRDRGGRHAARLARPLRVGDTARLRGHRPGPRQHLPRRHRTVGALAGPGGVATASTLGYLGMLLGPPAIGFMAEWISLPAALTSVAVLAAFASGIAFATRHSAAK